MPFTAFAGRAGKFRAWRDCRARNLIAAARSPADRRTANWSNPGHTLGVRGRGTEIPAACSGVRLRRGYRLSFSASTGNPLNRVGRFFRGCALQFSALLCAMRIAA